MAEWRKGCLPVVVRGYFGVVTAQPADPPAPARKYPAKNLDAISHVLDSPDVDDDVRARFRRAYAKAWAAARDGLTVQPLFDLVEGWFPEAVLWSDPDDARAYNAKIESYIRDGIPPERRVNAEEVLQALEAKHGKGAMGPVWDKLAGRA